MRSVVTTGIGRIGLVGLVGLACAACGNDGPSAQVVDAGTGPNDAPVMFGACDDFGSPARGVPAHVTGELAGADVTSPSACAIVDAPYGINSAGPDSVIPLGGLAIGVTYVVRLAAASDLGFYVVTGCATASGPSASQCLLFEDATGGGEVGRFVATASTAFIVVDYYAATSPNDLSYTLDVYAEECTMSAQCAGDDPVCHEGECVECASSFDCTTAARSRCDVDHTCQVGNDGCSTDDAYEPANDGPAGATPLALAADQAIHTGYVCSSPRSEADYVTFQVATVGETWDFDLAWIGSRDLDLEVFDAAGTSLGLSYWERPERARLTYLTPGTYYARVTEFATSPNSTGLDYTLTATRTTGAGCASAADCASAYRNQIYRGTCSAGACVAIDGDGGVAEGGACDSQSDCASALSCPSFYFVAEADTRGTCARACSTDAGCAALGETSVCTTYLPSNFCVQKCTTSEQCPTAPQTRPASGPWARLTCDLPTGRCLP